MEFTKEYFEKNYDLRLTDQQIEEVQKGGVVRAFETVPGTGIKNGLAVAAIDAPLQKVWAVIHDHNSFKDFMPNTKESILFDPSVLKDALDLDFDHSSSDPKVLMEFLKAHRVGEMVNASGYFFNLLDMPWPLKNLWYIIKLSDIKKENKWQNTWEMVAGNMKSDRGSWTLIPHTGDKTVVIYSAFADPGVVLPDPFVNLALNVGLPGIIRAVKKRVKKI
jgi:hypothetical protein